MKSLHDVKGNIRYPDVRCLTEEDIPEGTENEFGEWGIDFPGKMRDIWVEGVEEEWVGRGLWENEENNELLIIAFPDVNYYIRNMGIQHALRMIHSYHIEDWGGWWIDEAYVPEDPTRREQHPEFQTIPEWKS